MNSSSKGEGSEFRSISDGIFAFYLVFCIMFFILVIIATFIYCCYFANNNHSRQNPQEIEIEAMPRRLMLRAPSLQDFSSCRSEEFQLNSLEPKDFTLPTHQNHLSPNLKKTLN